MAEILAFSRPGERRSSPIDDDAARREVIVFPRTNIRELRRLWGLPEHGALVAGPDGRAIGALPDDGAAS